MPLVASGSCRRCAAKPDVGEDSPEEIEDRPVSARDGRSYRPDELCPVGALLALPGDAGCRTRPSSSKRTVAARCAD